MKTVTDTNYKKDEKKEFTPEEFAQAKHVSAFIIDLIKAISRSGYYDADHPVSQEVKKGLYEDFKKALGDSAEIMLTCQEYEEKVDIHISGVLNEPFNIRKLTQANTSDLFVPKLKDYFERKSLNSFVIKKHITPGHFESFIDIMSEPIADSADSSRLGEYLTKSLADHDITEVSTVFKTDVVLLRGKLPWRVSIILRRLAKDLKVIPLFRSASLEKMKEIKRQIVEDIIRPLNNTDLLKDLIINCDVIVSHLTELMEVDELENLIISSLPDDAVVSVSEVVLQVYKGYREENPSDEDAQAAKDREDYLAKILNIAAQRIVSENLSDAENLFEQLFEYKIIDFQMLPENLRMTIQNRILATDIVSKIDAYIEKIATVSSPKEMEALVVTFKRAMPEFVKRKEWDLVKRIVDGLCDLYARTASDLSTPVSVLKLPDSVFEGTEDMMADEYVRSDPEIRKDMNAILLLMKSRCIAIAGLIFAKSKEPDVIKSAVDFLCQKGEPARQWSLEIMDDPNQPLSLLNIALLVLADVGVDSDVKTMAKYVRHPNASIRSKALSVASKLSKKDAEDLMLNALKDQDEKVRTMALNLMEKELALSPESVDKIVLFVKEKVQKKNMTSSEAGFVSGLIKMLVKARGAEKNEKMENEVIGVASDIIKEKTGFLKFLKSDLDREQMEIVSACLMVLGKKGGAKSREFLKSLSRGSSEISKAADEAMNELNKKSSPM